MHWYIIHHITQYIPYVWSISPLIAPYNKQWCKPKKKLPSVYHWLWFANQIYVEIYIYGVGRCIPSNCQFNLLNWQKPTHNIHLSLQNNSQIKGLYVKWYGIYILQVMWHIYIVHICMAIGSTEAWGAGISLKICYQSMWVKWFWTVLKYGTEEYPIFVYSTCVARFIDCSWY